MGWSPSLGSQTRRHRRRSHPRCRPRHILRATPGHIRHHTGHLLLPHLLHLPQCCCCCCQIHLCLSHHRILPWDEWGRATRLGNRVPGEGNHIKSHPNLAATGPSTQKHHTHSSFESVRLARFEACAASWSGPVLDWYPTRKSCDKRGQIGMAYCLQIIANLHRFKQAGWIAQGWCSAGTWVECCRMATKRSWMRRISSKPVLRCSGFSSRTQDARSVHWRSVSSGGRHRSGDISQYY